MNLERGAIDRIVVGIAAIALVASMTLIPTWSASAQDAQLADGTSTETLASVSLTEDSGSRLVLVRITLDPGSTIRDHTHSGPAVFTVISGTLTADLVRGSATVDRGGVGQAVETGKLTNLSDGDSITFAPNAGERIENLGNEPLLLVASLLLKTDEPIFEYDFWPPPHTSAH